MVSGGSHVLPNFYGISSQSNPVYSCQSQLCLMFLSSGNLFTSYQAQNLMVTKRGTRFINKNLLQSKNVREETGNIFATFWGVVGITFFDLSNFVLIKLNPDGFLSSRAPTFQTLLWPHELTNNQEIGVK